MNMNNEEIISKIKINLSKNGYLISNLITHGLILKNLKNHYKLCKLNNNGNLKISSDVNTPYKKIIKLIEENKHLLKEYAIIENRNITYEQMIYEVDNLAKYLHYLIYAKKGEKISICANSSAEGIIAFFAESKLGLVNARIFNGSKEEKMKKNIIDFESKTILIDEKNIEVLNNIVNETAIKNVIMISDCDEQTLYNFRKTHPNINLITWNKVQKIGSEINLEYIEKCDEKDIASILYTSGSSGEAKPIIISNKVYITMADTIEKSTSVKKCDKEKVVGVVSHEYPYAAINSTIMVLLFGKTLIMPKNDKSGKISFNDLLKEKPEKIQAIPNLYKLLEMNDEEINDLSFLKNVVSGGETYLKQEKLSLLKFLSKKNSSSLLIDGFGFGEMGSAVALKFGLNDYFVLMNGIEAKAIDPETKKILPNDKEGILCFTGSTIANGYYNNEEATKKSFVSDENGKTWFVSDTYGSVHGNLNRLIKLGGRIREYFITADSNGNFVKVYAGAVEDMILSTGCIEDCVVVPSDSTGVPKPVAYVSLRTDCKLTKEELINTIINKCSNLEEFAQPSEIKIEEEIKRTDAKKKNYTYYKTKQLNN
ncbi:MAG: AMP-binding protein [Bacilli bacterium]|nr:AMP-binding protein [Bacilli bacterium]